jgi:hypothetical protein
MRAFSLTTRFREDTFEGEACLLVYDVPSLSGSVIGDDIRDVLDRRPNTPRIFVLAPFLPLSEVTAALKAGVAVQRASAVPSAGELAALSLSVNAQGKTEVLSRTYTVRDGEVVEGDARLLSGELHQGWLFDLFDSNRGRVDAPLGVHFGKASEKHSEKFLRTSSVLLSTAACAVVGFFALGTIRAQEPRRIFVDTAPLLSVAFAMQRIAAALDLWVGMPSAKSFSSYGGIDKLPSLGRDDLVLISASTSGGLARRLSGMEVDESALLTLFLLKSSAEMASPGHVLCDLTYVSGRTFGYPLVKNHSAGTCELCKRGYVLAELEGDQFLLERRGVKRLRIAEASQPRDAREAAELLARQKVLSVRLHKQDTRRTDVALDVQALLQQNNQVASDFRRLLQRFTPAPVKFIVLVGFSYDAFSEIVKQAGMEEICRSAKVVLADAVGQLDPIEGANALVVVDFLSDHALLRGINAQLRSKVLGGCVAYLSAVTIADSSRNLADLRIFLSYGERGPDTFTYRSALSFMLPWSGERPSSWAEELQLLQQISFEGSLPKALDERRICLEEASSMSEGLFLPGLKGPLTIARDFVFLNTEHNIEDISQADVYAIVSNLLATARCDNKGLTEPVRRDSPPLTWTQSVYGQVLLCPSNFRDFNDAVLRASMLRAANPAELNYSLDEQCSAEVLDVLLADIDAWDHHRGDALPEFLLSLACGRLRIARQHMERLMFKLTHAALPDHLNTLIGVIPQE